MKNTFRLLLALSLLSAFACSKEPEPVTVAVSTGDEAPPPPPVEEPPPPPAVEDPDDVHLEGDHVTIDQMIQFALDSDEILGESAEIIDHLATFINNHQGEIPGLRVIGHTDNQGAAGHNQRLSEARAAAVARALAERGVQIRLEAEGKGKTARLCTENTEECHARNRRVEFLIIPADG
ncbi:MAG: OmpA family protein [Myxococcales bacterium]|nr:OmpA family protein [Myxococcales bacterium]